MLHAVCSFLCHWWSLSSPCGIQILNPWHKDSFTYNKAAHTGCDENNKAKKEKHFH